MKTIKKFILSIVSLAAMTACEKEGDKIWLTGLEEGNLMATENEVVLTQETSKQMVLSLAWTGSTLSVSDPTMQAPNVLSTTLQVSTENDFSVHVAESAEHSLSKAYTGADLNTVAKNLGVVPDVATPLYFRLRTATGNNIAPVYSNVVNVRVTPYLIDMTQGLILDAQQADTGVRLYSPTSNGDYTGFMGATGWYNFYLKEGDGTTWGNEGKDGGPAFLLSSSEVKDERFNCWFPGIGGCYYVDVNTNKKAWTALLIPTLTVSGDIEAALTFDRPNVKWTTTFTATQTGTITVKIGGIGKQYDYATSTDDAAAKETPIGFVQNGESLIFGEQAGEITVNVPAVGECTLVIDLSNPRHWTAQAISGSTGPSEERTEIYYSGVNDDWNFHPLQATATKGVYAGSITIEKPSEWGFKIYLENGDWEQFYGGSDGKLYYQGDGITDDATLAPGIYTLTVDLVNETYSITK